ncbi:MAG: DNA internalization-related competence protein ComEC/Rec2 [Ruminococcus sp.]|nr:DNA internalization-related competence protein ComEC/Rec2 [Ruminococcus sp.]
MIKRPLCMASVLFLGIQAILVGRFHLASDWKPSRLEKSIEGKAQVVLGGTVYRREEKAEYEVLYLKNNQVHLKNQIFQESKILVYIKTKNQALIGNHIQISGEVGIFQSARNPGNFDQKFYYRKEGIHVYVWADEMKVRDASVNIVSENLALIRRKWKAMLTEYLGEYYGNSMSAILLGDKGDLDSNVRDLYQKSGIGHILAISGLHMSFLGNGLYSMLRKTGMSFKAAGAVGICFLLAYTLMTGCGVSSIRAFIMFLVRIGADMAGRDYDMPTSLALSAAIITAWQPLYLFDAGFLLSFGALLGITGVAPCLEFCFLKERKGGKVPRGIKFLKGFYSSLAVNITLLPIMLYFFFEFPPYSIFLNLFVIPLTSVVMGAGVFGSLAVLVSSKAGELMLFICKCILYLYDKACQISLSFPGSRIITGQPSKVMIFCYYILLFLFCIFIYICKNDSKTEKSHFLFLVKEGWKKTFGNLSMTVIVIVLILPGYFASQGSGKLTVTMLDVGQGDGLYIKGPEGMNYFVDGGSSDVSSVGKYRIEPFLKSRGVASLDYVFISHGDADHMNGIEELLENQKMGIRIKTLVLPPEEVQDDPLKALARKAAGHGTRVAVMNEGDTLTEGDMKLTCMAPAQAYRGEPGNAASMVLEIEFQEFDMLFTGDVEGEGEQLLGKNKQLKKFDVLKAAHHGSKNSSSEEFLEQTKPRVSWISAGVENRYGHPHEETLKRLDAVGSRIYSTQQCGAVTLVTDGERLEVLPYLLEH